MITRAIRSPINPSIHDRTGDHIWEYKKARLWSRQFVEDTEAPVWPNLRDRASREDEASSGR